MTVKTLFPVIRVHQPLRVDADIENGIVTDARVGGMLFRGFELMLANRDPRDAMVLTRHICGYCASAHAIAAAMAQQQAGGITPAPNGQHLTNLILATAIIHNHLRHFYLLTVWDYVLNPKYASYSPGTQADYRLPKKINDELVSHINDAMLIAARAQDMMAALGGKAPHQQLFLPTGITQTISTDQLAAYDGLLREISKWVRQFYVADVMTIADYYQDYYHIGAGYGNFLSFGMFPIPGSNLREFSPGKIINRDQAEPIAVDKIAEDIRFSWFSADIADPEASPAPDPDKPEAYSWIKAPRYQEQAFEGGPLARSWINGHYRRGVSVMDRLVAGVLETIQLCELAANWLEQVTPNAPIGMPYTLPKEGSGIGLTDTSQGCLGHWLTIQNDKIKEYRIITPSTWNFSPRDAQGLRGPVEEALIGTPVADDNDMVEVVRVIHSFEPCMPCATH